MLVAMFQLSILQIIVGALLLGSIVLVVGLVQLMPNAADADHRFLFLSAGSGLLLGGIMMTALRYFCMRRRYMRHTTDEPPPQIDAVNSIDDLVQRKDTQVIAFPMRCRFRSITYVWCM